MNLGVFRGPRIGTFIYVIFSARLLSDSQSSVHFFWARNLQFLGGSLLLGYRFELNKLQSLIGAAAFNLGYVENIHSCQFLLQVVQALIYHLFGFGFSCLLKEVEPTSDLFELSASTPKFGKVFSSSSTRIVRF